MVSFPNNRWLAPKEAAVYIGCSPSFLDKDRVTGLHGIPFTRLGRHIRYDRFDLDAYLERGKNTQGLESTLPQEECS